MKICCGKWNLSFNHCLFLPCPNMILYLYVYISKYFAKWEETSMELNCTAVLLGNALNIIMNKLLLKFSYLNQTSHLTFHYLVEPFINSMI